MAMSFSLSSSLASDLVMDLQETSSDSTITMAWIGGGNDSSVREITVVIMSSIGLVVSIHGICGKSPNIIGGKASSSWLNWLAINILAANIVDVCLQSLIASICLGHTPFLSPCCRFWNSSSYWCWSMLEIGCHGKA
uniref:Uncharacterized protein n=1 Tax=Lotus japonicus TaxID=34305 RepID=I3SCI2_LOTJA|nr:unknown [Lotus japonicus]